MGNHSLELGMIVRKGYKIFDFEYPFYSEAHRHEFEDKFLLHFRYHEIGQESLQRFKYMLQDTLTMNHDKYLHYFKTKEVADTLPWWDNKNNVIDSERNLGRHSDSSSSDSSHDESQSSSFSQDDDISDSTNRFLDTPQGKIENLDEYLTTANKDHSEDISTSNSDTTVSNDSSSQSSNSMNSSTKETYHRTEHGNVGSTTAGTIVSDWLNKAFIDVDHMIMNDCEELFMQVY